jgi:hypothetical protein
VRTEKINRRSLHCAIPLVSGLSRTFHRTGRRKRMESGTEVRFVPDLGGGNPSTMPTVLI